MKSLQEHLTGAINEAGVTESRTRLEDIEQYAKSWVNEWGFEYFGNVMTSFLKGMQAAVKEEEDIFNGDKEDEKFLNRCKSFIERVSKEANKEIY